MEGSELPPAGWYPDKPSGGYRFWNGQAWTDHRPPSGAEGEAAGAKALAESVTAVFGAIAAAATLIVIPGGLAMLLRLEVADLPANLGIVASLPERFLLAIGLAYVLSPLLVVVALTLFVVLVPGAPGKPNPGLESCPQTGEPPC